MARPERRSDSERIQTLEAEVIRLSREVARLTQAYGRLEDEQLDQLQAASEAARARGEEARKRFFAARADLMRVAGRR